MKVVILEDERLTAQRLESLLHRYDPEIRVLATLPSVEKAVAWFSQPQPEKPDLVFMDIHLQDGLAFRVIEQVKLTTPIIFTTAFDEYVIQAFKVNSIDYLLKPLSYDELVAAITKYKKLKEHFAQPSSSAPPTAPMAVPDMDALVRMLGAFKETTYKDRFMITVGSKIRSVETSEIAYFFLDERMAFLVTKDGATLPVDYSLDKLTTLLNPKQFFRISRQFLVTLSAIQTIYTYSAGKWRLDLQPKSRLEAFVSGDRIAELKEWLGK
ncbi:LytR/AlgR family response regulator transcription factor [Larkinella sp. GY13]|uniref:LytR/AlgR family response regulator transcription factor n=1 Tax=Larkinella sp. GY13 TaxID=3453720 RepID=UPI003EEA3D69